MKNFFFILFVFIGYLAFPNITDPEEKFEFKYYKITEFTDGMRFMVEPNGYLINQGFFKYHKKGKGKKVDLNLYKGEIFVFRRYEEKLSKHKKDKKKIVFIVFEKGGELYEYNTNETYEELKQSESYIHKNVEDFVFYEDVVLSKTYFLDQTFYLTKEPESGAPINSLYKVVQIDIMNADYPIVLLYQNVNGGKIYEDQVRLSGTNEKHICSNNHICDFKDYFLDMEQYKVIEEERRLKEEIEKEKLRITDSIAKAKKEKELQKELAEEIIRLREEIEKRKKECSYRTNKTDEFTGKRLIATKYYDLDLGTSTRRDLIIGLMRNGKDKFITIACDIDLGCVSPYKNNQSYVKFKLENGKIITFYHKVSLDCSNFELTSTLTNSKISELKKSAIKTIRFSGTKHYHDAKDIGWSTFFIDQLDCIK
ncbi:hypothetical protein [Aquimarina sp. 2201CG5-10]|uniref:hypothetical protein n=1 Tax=Aquimarina callyspongiae TaxID=3098150 RepID=UPI002AB5CFE9|nr:hypothetical protein [Aquimarina sp. 2201CG5-10]MDY8137614.1 hypothetical protein [Aquimarina sp. 2201CG5-10]